MVSPVISCENSRPSTEWKAGERVGGLHFKGGNTDFQGTCTKDGLLIINVAPEKFAKWGIDSSLSGEMGAVALRKNPNSNELTVVGVMVGNTEAKIPGNLNSEHYFKPVAFQYADGRTIKAAELPAGDVRAEEFDKKYYMNRKTDNIAAPGDLPPKEQTTLKKHGTSPNKTTDDLGASVLTLEAQDKGRTQALGTQVQGSVTLDGTTVEKKAPAPTPGKQNVR